MKDIFLIDADDTLFDFHASSTLAVKEAFKKCNIEWKEEYMSVYRQVNGELWAKLERQELTRDELMENRFSIYLAVLGLPADGKELNRHYVECVSNTPMYYEGAESFLATLAKKGRVYIVTNGTRDIQRARFDIAKLWEKVDGVFISQIVGYDKPDPRYTAHVETHIDGYTKARAVWIGDSLSADIQAANDANITSIWYNRLEKPLTGNAKPDFTAKNFEEILEILENI